MRRIHYFGWKQRKGIALLLVMFIAFASLVLLTTLYSSLAPRAISVRGQAQSDRALALADGTIDRLLDQINNTGLTYSASMPQSEQAITESLVKQLVLDINGGSLSQSYNDLLANVRHYFYDIQTDTYYVLKNDGDPVATGTLTDLSTNTDVAGGLNGIDNKYSSDNRWFQLDANAKYWVHPGTTPDTWEIGATAFNMSNPDIKRTIRAEAQRGDITTNAIDVADGAWFVPSSTTEYNFADYAGLYHSTVYFGQFEVTSGYVRSDGDLWMGGWAQDIVSAHGSVNDMAIDDGNRHDGNFGIDGVSLSTAQSQGLALDSAHGGVALANWPAGDAALLSILNASKLSAYNVNGPATIEFYVDSNGVGMVKINTVPYPLPANVTGGGVIYVSGDATVSGTLKGGKVTIGSGSNILIGGNIKYSTDPQIDKNAPPVDPSLQDALGLIAHNNVIIPVSTYNANHTLEIDAAMLAVQGYFGIDRDHYGNYPPHPLISTPPQTPWVGIWNGSQSVYSGYSAPALSNGSSVWGYEVQHTNYDYNLSNGARPPLYPAAEISQTSHVVYAVYNGPDLATLQALTRSQLTVVTASTNPSAYADGKRYSYTIGQTTYYYGDQFNWSYSGVYTASKNSLYRVSWKEEIAKPVGSP